VAKYQSFQVDPTKAGSALTWLHNEALKNNRNVVSQFVRNELLMAVIRYTLPRIITMDKLFTSLLKDSGV
jgi:hypothetical protein